MLNIPLFARINPFVQTTPYRELYRCYPAAFSTKKDLEDGDKVILPPSALHHLASLKVTYPLVFELSNPRTGKKTHCGVLEFSSNEGECYVPYWIMQNLLIKSGAMIQITNASLPKGNFVKFQPHETSFTLLSNPRVVLEKALRRYTCLTQGDTVNITHDGKRYEVDILEVRPGTAITVIETDVNVEFAAPKDYKEPPKSEKKIDTTHQHQHAEGNFVYKGEHETQKTMDDYEREVKDHKKTSSSHPSSHSSSTSHSSSSSSSTSSSNSNNSNYFAQLGTGYSLKESNSSSSASSSSSSVSSSSSTSSTSTSSSSSVLQNGNTYQEQHGQFIYIYQKPSKPGGQPKLIRRIPASRNSTNTSTSTSGSTSSVTSTSTTAATTGGFKAFQGQGYSMR